MPGARERKRVATRERIAAAGLELFLELGYEATTIDGIAAASGISRRTFFYYFSSKDDALLAWHGAGAVSTRITAALHGRRADASPLATALDCLTELASQYETEQSRAVDALMQSSPTLRARKDAVELGIERDLAAAMTELWPAESRLIEIRFAAMMAAGTLRMSLEDWRNDGSLPLSAHLRRNADLLRCDVLREIESAVLEPRPRQEDVTP